MKTLLALLAALAFLPGMPMNNEIYKHAPHIQRLAPNADLATVLALIQIESRGNPAAHTPGTSFYGLLQMNTGYLRTALPDRNVKGADLIGDPTLALQAFASIHKISRRWHLNDPDLVGFGHKAGLGSLKRYATIHAPKGETIDQAIPAIVEYYKKLGYNLPRVPEYLARFREAYAVWHLFLTPSQEAAQHYDEMEGVCWVDEPLEDSLPG